MIKKGVSGTADKKIPMRMCLGCGTRQPKRELVRIVKTPEDGKILLDPTGRQNGRGCYVCRKQECMDLIIRKKKLSRSLDTDIDQGTIERLAAEFRELPGINGGQTIE